MAFYLWRRLSRPTWQNLLRLTNDQTDPARGFFNNGSCTVLQHCAYGLRKSGHLNKMRRCRQKFNNLFQFNGSSVPLEKQNGLFYLAKIFHHEPQHWPHHVGCLNSSCRLHSFNFSLEKIVSQNMHEGFCETQFFRCKWNRNERNHHSISFYSTQWSVMLIIRKASIIVSTHNYAEQTLTTLQINKTLTRTTIHSNTRGRAHEFFHLLDRWFTS